MTPLLRSLLRASRATSAALLLGVFVLGATLHGLHHLQDPACADGVDRSGHSCAVCSGLHGSTLAASAMVTPAPRTVAWTPYECAPAPSPSGRPHVAASPRAPPQG